MAFCCCWIFLCFKKTSAIDTAGGRLHVVLRRPFPCNTTASLIRGISMNDESSEGIKKEGTSQTRGNPLSAATGPMPVRPAAAEPSPAPGHLLLCLHRTANVSEQGRRCHLAPCRIEWETQFPGNKKPWILREALISQSCKAVLWGFSHRMRRREIH